MVALVVMVFLGLNPALAQTFPQLTGRVVDAANLLKPEERAALEAKLKAHEDKTTGSSGTGSSAGRARTTAHCSSSRRRSGRYASKWVTGWKVR
jgi:hypothetical protein